jgi:hypothetical protein
LLDSQDFLEVFSMTDSKYTVAYRKLSEALKRWEDGDGPTIDGRKAISQDLSEAIEKAVNDTSDLETIGDSVKVHEIQDDYLEYAIGFDALATAYRDFKRRACSAVSLSEIDVDGDQPLWRAIYGLRELAQTKYNYQPPTPIPALRSQGVGDEQIARIYGWYTEDGEPDLERVLGEELSPGKFYNPKTWVHPAKRKRIEAARAAVANRSPRGREYIDSSEFGKTAPPSLEELLRLGAPAPQIASLYKMDLEDAEELLAKYETEHPKQDQPSLEGNLKRDTESESDSTQKAGKGKK